MESYEVDTQADTTMGNATFTVRHLRTSEATSPLSPYLFAAYSHVSVPL